MLLEPLTFNVYTSTKRINTSTRLKPDCSRLIHHHWKSSGDSPLLSYPSPAARAPAFTVLSDSDFRLSHTLPCSLLLSTLSIPRQNSGNYPQHPPHSNLKIAVSSAIFHSFLCWQSQELALVHLSSPEALPTLAFQSPPYGSRISVSACFRQLRLDHHTNLADLVYYFPLASIPHPINTDVSLLNSSCDCWLACYGRRWFTYPSPRPGSEASIFLENDEDFAPQLKFLTKVPAGFHFLS